MHPQDAGQHLRGSDQQASGARNLGPVDATEMSKSVFTGPLLGTRPIDENWVSMGGAGRRPCVSVLKGGGEVRNKATPFGQAP